MSKRKNENGLSEFVPLHHGEEKLTDTDNGYTFHCGDGNVKYRSHEEHNQVLESRTFVEPPARKSQSIGQVMGLE